MRTNFLLGRQGTFPKDFVPFGMHYSQRMHESLARQENACAIYAACPEAIMLKYHCLDKAALSKL